MKKISLSLFCFVIMALTFSSCHKVESDYYFPKTKLQSVICADLNYNFALSYDKKYIRQVVLGDDVYSVTYDGKQITQIVGVNDDEAATITYNDHQISRIEYYDDGELDYYQEFQYQDGKISRISTHLVSKAVAKWSELRNAPLFNLMFDVESMDVALAQQTKGFNRSLDGEMAVTYMEDDIQTLTTTYTTLVGETKLQQTFAYDDQNNPYYGLPYAIIGTKAYSAHNIVSRKLVTYQNNVQISSDIDLYSYQYGENGYPAFMLDEDNLYAFTYVQ